MPKFPIIAVLGLAFTLVSLLALGQQPLVPKTHSPEELAGLMRAKLASSQKVVEGLMARDFALIHKGGEEMTKVCDATQWHDSEDQVYAHYRSELRRTAKKLMVLAEEKNLDGAAYTYMHSLTTCISCHDYCRDTLHLAAIPSTYKAVAIPVTEEETGRGRLPALRR